MLLIEEVLLLPFFLLQLFLCSVLKALTLMAKQLDISVKDAVAPLAQLVEQLTLNQWVRGSSPRRCTTTCG